jgi:hypothetical protein
MRGKLMFLAGLGAGFVLGSRAGREKYEEIVQAARKVRENPTVQEAAGVVQEQANKFVAGTKDTVTDKLSHSKLAETKVGERLLSAAQSGTSTRDDTLATSGVGTTTPRPATTPPTTTPTTGNTTGGL